MNWFILWLALFALAFTALFILHCLLNEDFMAKLSGDRDNEKTILRQILQELKDIKSIEQQNANGISLLVGVLIRHYPSSFVIKQLHKPQPQQVRSILQGDPMAVTGIVLGQTGTFQEVPQPDGSAFPSGTTFVWTSDDTLTSLTPSADGTQCAVATSTSDTQTSFNLTCQSDFTPPGGSAPLSATVNVPLLPVPVPTPSSMTINQLS